MHRNFYRIPLGYDIVMSVHPNIMNSTDRLKQYPEDKRQCAKDEESRQLSFFKNYTQRNCQLCELSFRQNQACKCVEYGLPREKDQPICRSKINLKCIEHVESETVLNIFNKSAVSFNCLPSCNSISYDAEISMAEFDERESEDLDPTKILNAMKGIKKSRVLITFKDEQFFASRRAEMYSITGK